MDTAVQNRIEDIATPLTGKQKKAIAAATLGTVVEFCDWIVYATFASMFAPSFFATNDPKVSLLSAFAVFAVGFIMRPIGGAVIGSYTDRHGRRAGLTLSIALMAGSSLVIAVCPVYHTIGIAAPLILVLSRLVQGFAAGGEFGSASTFLIESCSPSRRGFAGSWQHFAVNAGVMLAVFIGYVLTSVISPPHMTVWGWRVGFALAGLMGFVALWVRLSISETDVFQRTASARRHHRNAFVTIMKEHRGSALRVIGISMAGNLSIYLWMVLFPTFAHLRTGLPLNVTFSAGVIAIFASLLVIPLIGNLSDRIGRRPILLTFAAGSALFAWPSLHFMAASFWNVTVIATIGMLLSSGFTATCAAVMAEQFPSEVRATGVALPYAISATVFGGTLPYIVTAMTGAGLFDYIWVYVAAVCLVGLCVYATMPETKGKLLS